jgi:hypothetical protein
MVLVARERHGARVKKTYDAAKTPCRRVLEAPDSPAGGKTRLRGFCARLNPLLLLRQIETAQHTLRQLA